MALVGTNIEKSDVKFVTATFKPPSIPEWAMCLIRYYVIFHDCANGLNLQFRNPEKNCKGKINMFRPMRSSGLSRYQVMINYRGVVLRRTSSLVSQVRQMHVPFCSFSGSLLVCHLLVVCCICIIHIFSLAR